MSRKEVLVDFPFLKDLNKQQFIAATTLNGPVLILAGAGTGKTKTIISRSVYIIAKKEALPQEILIMTFTNKAAREMKERGQKMLLNTGHWNGSIPNFTTFHSWGIKFVKSMSPDILSRFGLTVNFTIADDSDQKSILNKLKEHIFSAEEAKDIKVKNLLLPFGNIQNHLIDYENQENAFNAITALINEMGDRWLGDSIPGPITPSLIDKLATLYVEYKSTLRSNNMIDFEDLINIPIYIMQENPRITANLKEFYKYIMVDEFQDTNGSQLTLLKLLLNPTENLCVVGDDSQSIYGWRGANIEYILNFHNVYESAKKINLKINYRSTPEIVDIANTLLRNAQQRHEFKEFLEAFKGSNGTVRGKYFVSAEKEASAVVKLIKKAIVQRKCYPGDIAILYRSALVNRKVEEELIFNQIDYKIHRGKSLLERKASLEIISYLKLLTNIDNSIALSKVLVSAKIATDKRIAQMQKEAEDIGQTFYMYLLEGEFEIKGLRKDTKEKLCSFGRELKYYEKMLKDISNPNHISDFGLFIVEFFARNSVSRMYKKIVKAKLEGEKVSEEMFSSASGAVKIFDIIQDLLGRFNSIEEFLEVIALEGEEEDTEQGKVNLMTVHASKGLEFEFVFILGFSQGVFPSARSTTFLEVEEERRLAYVALTRAKNSLFVTGAAKYFGSPNEESKPPSQFFNEADISLD